MRLGVPLWLLAVPITFVSATTNAERFGRGLPPLKPSKLYSPTKVDSARRSTASGTCSDTFVCCQNWGLALNYGSTFEGTGIIVDDLSSDIGVGCDPPAPNLPPATPPHRCDGNYYLLCCKHFNDAYDVASDCSVVPVY